MKRRGGGKLTIADFTPDFATPKKSAKDKEENLKGFMIALANKKKP
jgi:hypothetical protein